ncbi:putative LysR family transcriptional regulator [Rhizobium freirei PRF 81]|uniref:Putative LysR family transcriptional regulator n=1 Tax=Rhizobium freirei PRF 81 TaxID=363754 RepID=N6UWF2_9HYPH|nr:LysR family transcriptional regulator [Rhizobium freirei]ENN86010.1 putative LysR family transcriptional regulator [Rhizobium freirei PRF 81]
METVQLSYFILACQFKNHAEAAAHAKMSASTISENIDALERELGMTLFERGPHGHYPTEAARWLYQSVEPLLQAVEAAETILQAEPRRPIKRLEITSPLQFMAGRLSRAASLASRAVREVSPNIVATTRFTLGRAPYVHALEWSTNEQPHNGSSGETAQAARIVLDYAQDSEEPDSILLFRDEWIAISGGGNRHAVGDGVISFAALRKKPLFLPPLGDTQLRQARAYCSTHDLPEPVVIEEDVGTFARLSRELAPFHLLAPQSLVMASVARLNLAHAKLPIELVSPVIARIPAGEPAALHYVEELQKALQLPSCFVQYRSRITMKQIRYFLAISEQLSVTAAAKHLSVAQPALSNQLRKLEAITGRNLFVRHRTGLERNDSTDTLVALVEPAAKACDGIAASAAHYAATRRERLAIGIVPLIHHEGPLARALAGALDEWSSLHPTVKLKIMEGSTEALRRWVDAGEIGFGLVETQISRSWQVDLAIEDFFGVVSNPAKSILPAGEITLRNALKLPLALPGDASGLRQILDKAASEAGMHLAPQMEVNSLTALLALVKRMRVATILPQSSVRTFVEAGVLQFNPISSPVVRSRLSILFSPERILTDVERSLINALKRQLSAMGMSKEISSTRAIYWPER